MITKGGTQQMEGFDRCASSCKELLVKMSGSRFPWKLLLFLVFATVGGLLAFDLFSSKEFKHSKTKKILVDSGLLAFLEQVWKRASLYSKKAFVWLQENVPIYYSKVCEFVGPYLQLFWEKLYDLGVYIVHVTQPARDWLNKKVPELLEWIQKNFPWILDGAMYYLGVAWNFIVTYSLLIWERLVTFTNTATTWLLTNVFTGSLAPENILKTLSSVLATLQSYIVAGIQWIYTAISGAMAKSDAADAVKQQ